MTATRIIDNTYTIFSKKKIHKNFRFHTSHYKKKHDHLTNSLTWTTKWGGTLRAISRQREIAANPLQGRNASQYERANSSISWVAIYQDLSGHAKSFWLPSGFRPDFD